jgi:hypothetical protein
MATFGEPVYDVEESRADAGGGDPTFDPALDSPSGELDPNDPRLVSEELTDNSAGDAYALPPTPPDGYYRVQLRDAGIKGPDGQTVADKAIPITWLPVPTVSLAVNVELTIIDPAPGSRAAGIKVTDYWLKTFTDPRNDGTSQIATILRKGGQVVPPRHTQRALMAQFHKWLAGEPEIGAYLRWEGDCMDCAKEDKEAGRKGKDKHAAKTMRGMKHFPADGHGGYLTETCCTVNPAHGITAQLRVGRYLSLADMEAAKKGKK